MDPLAILGTTMGIGLLSGIRLYATVLGLGLALRFGWLELPAAMRGLDVLANPWVIGVAAAAYAAEFVSDKIPWFDSLWDGIHTVVRPVGAAVLAATAFAELDPVPRILLTLLCGGVALSSHASKAATRLAVNHSPEPFSNWALSLLGDIAAPAGLWFVFAHPVLAAILVIVFLLAFFWLARKIWRVLRSGWERLRSRPRAQAA
jgi:hypothetical protein